MKHDQYIFSIVDIFWYLELEYYVKRNSWWIVARKQFTVIKTIISIIFMDSLENNIEMKHVENKYIKIIP